MSQHCYFTLKTLNDTCSFKVAAESMDQVSDFFYQFMMLFPGIMDFETRKINCLTNNSEKLKEALHAFVQAHPEMPGLNAVEAFVRNLADDESFFVIPELLPNQTQSIKLTNYLKAQNNGTNFEKLNEEIDSLFGDLMNSYQIDVYGEKRRVTGEKIKANRTCRFCRRSHPAVTFNKKAHAISEGLGNKTLVLTEECDECNWEFSQTIEPDLINYLAMYRTFYGLKGKGGTKEFKGKNFKLFKDDVMQLHFTENEDNVEDTNGFPSKIKLDTGRLIKNQNIYKTLVKYVLSVIETEKLVDLQDTINWINGTFTIEKLPVIAEFAFYDKLIEQPIMTVYTRTDENVDYPYMVGEFHYAFFKYIFIIPATTRDNFNFVKKEEHDIFWKKFKHFDSLRSYAEFKDFSDNTEREFNITLNMNRTKKNEND